MSMMLEFSAGNCRLHYYRPGFRAKYWQTRTKEHINVPNIRPLRLAEVIAVVKTLANLSMVSLITPTETS